MSEPRLEDWSIVMSLASPYAAPETGTAVLRGKVFGHPRFKDGEPIRTSTLIKADPTAGWAETLNTTYRLGSIEAGFQKYLDDHKIAIEKYKIGLDDKELIK